MNLGPLWRPYLTFNSLTRKIYYVILASVKDNYLTVIAGDFLLSIEEVVKIGKLFSFYGSLLTERQQEFMQLYYYHDLSLGEIAEQQDISRQAVYDNLKRSEKALKEYEKNLELVKYYDNIEIQIDRLGNVVDQISDKLNQEEVNDLQGIIERLKAYQKGELE